MFKKKKTEDKTNDKTKDKPKVDLPFYEKMINDLIASHGLDPEKCRHRPKMLWSAYRGSALIYTEIFPLNEVYYVEISCPVMKIPSKNLLPFYRRLLETNYQLIGVSFFLKQDILYLSANRELKGLDPEELRLMEDRVSFNADKLDDLLIEEFKSYNG